MIETPPPAPLPRRSRRTFGNAEEGGAGDHRDRWLISYADLVTLLFSLFVVLYAAADENRARAVQSAMAAQISGAPSSPPDRMPGGRGVLPGADSLLAARGAVERALSANESLRSRTRMTEVERGFIVSLAEAGFFDPGDAAVRKEAGPTLDALADTLRKSQALIRVEGHTDSTPIATARYPSNWELSSARASAVLARLVARGVPPARISIAGYAGERPVADNDTPAGRALNRRVDLVVLQSQ